METMLDVKDPNLISNYTRQYGWIARRGTRYLAAVLTQYVENGCNATKSDYSRFIKEAAAKFEVKPASFRSVINRFLHSCWEGKTKFVWEWEHYAGWSEPRPPKVSEAVRLICEAYVPFVAKYEELICNQHAYYLRMDIEAYDKGEWSPRWSPQLEDI